MPKFPPKPGRDATLEICVQGDFEVTLLQDGLICGRQWTDSPSQAGNLIRAWQGPLTDRRARYSVRRTA